MIEWTNTILQGLLLGGLYALFATGLSLSFGIMRLVNIAHGDMIVLAAYLGFVVVSQLGLNPFLALLVVVPLMAVWGYLLQRLVLGRSLGGSILTPLMVTYGLSIITQNVLVGVFSADSRAIQAGGIETAAVHLGGGITLGLYPLIVMATAVAVIVGLQLLLGRTEPGPRLPRHLGRPGDGAADGHRQQGAVRPRHGHRHGHRRHRRPLSRHAHQFRSGGRAVAPALRLRGGGDRRPGFAVGDAGGGHAAGRVAGHWLPPRSRLGNPVQPPRLPRRAGAEAQRPVPPYPRPLTAGAIMSLENVMPAVAVAPADKPAYRVERATTSARVGAVVLAVVLAAMVSMPWWASRADMRTAGEILYVLALAQTWNLLAGYGGLISMGQQAFVGLGAYALVVFSMKLGINPFLAVPLAGLVTAVISVPTAAVVFRLRGAYFAVGTWVVSEVFRLLVTNSMWLAGGNGLSITAALIDIPQWWRESMILWFSVALGGGATLALYLILRSRHGLALKAIRDSEAAAESVGVKVATVKWAVFVAAAFGCGAIGALAFITKLRVAPGAAFSLDWMTTMVFLVVIGGIGTIEGPIIGAVVFFGLRALLADYGATYLIVLGALAALVMLKMPEGLYGYAARRFRLDFFPVQRRLRLLDKGKLP
ncbi:MAG: ABC transporter permease [Magnetospirillum sp.]|nr:ABC transporter permease [Magnetospirillum sp.]